MTRKITRAVAEVSVGRRQTVALGNLDAERDWGFAGDFVDAMWRILQADRADDWVVGTGQTHSVREFCERAFAHIGVELDWRGSGVEEIGFDRSTGDTRVVVDARYFRPAEVDSLEADSSKARLELKWEPQVTFEELVKMMVDADLDAVGVG